MIGEGLYVWSYLSRIGVVTVRITENGSGNGRFIEVGISLVGMKTIHNKMHCGSFL